MTRFGGDPGGSEVGRGGRNRELVGMHSTPDHFRYLAEVGIARSGRLPTVYWSEGRLKVESSNWKLGDLPTEQGSTVHPVCKGNAP